VEVREEVRQLAEPLAEEHGYELVDIEQASLGHHRVIRVFLDKPGGVTVDDCARFSRRLADAMDMNQIVPRRWEGVLLGPDGGRAGVRTDEGDEQWFEWAEVRSARLVVDPWAGLRQPKARPHGKAARSGEGRGAEGRGAER